MNTNSTGDTGAADTTGSDPVVEVKEKRSRLSPRTKAFDEALAMIDAHIADLTEEMKNNPGDCHHNKIAIATATDLRGKVEGMSNEGLQKPNYNGRHYIAVLADGSRVGFDCNTLPTKRSHGEGTASNYMSVLGPFRTVEGVNFRIEHPEEACPVIF
jgi:hypothetical protein